MATHSGSAAVVPAGHSQGPCSARAVVTSRGRWLNILLLVVSSGFAILLAEAGLRILNGRLDLQNNRDRFRDLFSGATPAVYDSRLGWVPRPGSSSAHTFWNTQVTIRDDGTRSNGREVDVPDQGEPLLAVGDSFTYGDGVSDGDTWPAILESLLGQRVINGGVFNYGVDQAYLRARELIERFHPHILIFSFISDDVRRATLSVRTGVGKPYFDVSDGTLKLRNVPVPRISRADAGPAGLQRLLGYSLLAHTILMNHRFRGWYLRGIWDERDKKAHDKGDEVACLIIDELGHMARTSDLQVYLLAQYGRWETDETVAVTRKALRCADPSVIHVVDLLPSLSALKSADEKEYASLYSGHMSPKGNRFVALKLQAAIQRAEQSARNHSTNLE